MSLSNTAAPRYYGEFRDKVLSGEIPVNNYISMQMNRIDERIRDPNFYYDPEPVERYIRFCENELTLTDGSNLYLLDSFKLWAEDIFGWYYFVDRSVYVPRSNGYGGHYVRKQVKTRLTNKQYIIVGRGGAKSLYGTTIQAFGLCCDKATTYGVTTAPTMRQAEEIVSPLVTAITRSRGPLFKFMTEGSLQNTTGKKENRVKLASTKKGVQNFITNSILEVRPMTIDKLQGLRSKYNTVDEWLSGETREDVTTPIEQGASKEKDWIIVLTSSEGTIRNGTGDTIKMELLSILRGEYKNPHTSIWWYALDDVKEVGDPSMWVKANPNLGKTVSYETYQIEVERAEKVPSVRNDILAKRFGLAMEGFTYFFTYEETVLHRTRDYWNMRCTLGIDLSRGDDFCAFTFLFPLYDGRFGIKTRAYITENTLFKLQGATREKYEEFIDEGSLIIMEQTVLEMDKVAQDLMDFIEKQKYDVLWSGYDPYNARDFLVVWEQFYGPNHAEKVIQGGKTESVPLGELKIYAEHRELLFDQEIMKFCMGNCITIKDSNGNQKLAKRVLGEKIDTVSALMDAYVSYKSHKDDFE